MNVFDFAMQMEIDGKAYYEKLVERSSHPGFSTIFRRLAEDEQKHYEIFQKLKTGAVVPVLQDSSVIADAKNIFSALPKAEKSLESLQGDLEAYRHAMQIEADSFRFYEDAASQEADAAIKRLLLQIAEEEHQHFNVLENIFHFVNAPNQYLCWGEFSNLDEFRQFGREVDI